MDLLIVIAGLISYIVVGLCILSFCKIRLGLLTKSALGFGIGASTVSLVIFVYSLLGIQISFFTVLIPWYIVFLYLLKAGRIMDEQESEKEQFVLVDYFFMFLIFLSVGISTVYALLYPVSSWDAVATWSMLAKAFFYEQLLSGEIYRFFNFDNPPLMSLQQSFLSVLIGKYNDKEVLLLFSAYFVFLLVLFYSLVKRISTKTNALIFTFLLSSVPLFLGQAGRHSVGYIDLPLAYFIFSIIMIIYLALPSLTPRNIFLIGYLLSLSVLTKNEAMGVGIIVSIIMLVVLLKKTKVKYLLYFMIGILPVVGWYVYSAYNNLPSHYLYSGTVVLSRVPEITFSFIREAFAVSKWNFLWMTFLISLLLFTKNNFMQIVITILTFQLLLYFSIYLITPLDFVSHMQASLDRFLLQVSPLALLVIAYVFSKPSIYND